LTEQTFQDTAEDVAVMIRDALRICSHDRELSTEPSVGIHAGNIHAVKGDPETRTVFATLEGRTHIMAHLSIARTPIFPLFFGFFTRGKPQA